MAETDETSDVSALTVQLLSAYLANNTVPAEALAELIRTTKAALTQETSLSAEVSDPEIFTPAVTARKSLASPEHIISLIDGKPYKTLKRHLASRGLTPEEYRKRYNLPANYPMVAPAYADHRRAVAHRLGLGRKGPRPEAAEEQDKTAPSEATDTQPGPEPVVARAVPSKPPRKTSTKRALQGLKDLTAGQPDSPADMGDGPSPDTNTDNGTPVPSVETSPNPSPASAPRQAKPAPIKKNASAKSKPRGKVAAEALDGTEAVMPTASIEQDAAKTKTTRRRGKMSLFKSANSEPVGLAEGADKQPAATSAQPEDKASGSEQPTAPAKSKARGSKRMAREPKSEMT